MRPLNEPAIVPMIVVIVWLSRTVRAPCALGEDGGEGLAEVGDDDEDDSIGDDDDDDDDAGVSFVVYLS